MKHPRIRIRLWGGIVALLVVMTGCGGDSDRLARLEGENAALREQLEALTASIEASSEATATDQTPVSTAATLATTSTTIATTTVPAEIPESTTTTSEFNPNEVTPERQELVDVVREYLSNSTENPVAGWSDEQIVAAAKAACQTPDDRLIDWASSSPEEGLFAKLARKHCAGEPLALDFGLWEELFIQESRVLTQESALYRNLSDAEILDDAYAACETFFANGNEIEIVKHFWRSTSSSELEAQAAEAFVVLAIDDYQLCFGH